MNTTSPRTLATAELRNRPSLTPGKAINPKQHKTWTKHTFRAVFKEFAHRYDPRSMRQSRTAVLTDVYMDGKLLTLNWTVDAPPTLARLCKAPGCTIEFEADFASTGYEVKLRGCPMLRAPFLAVVQGKAVKA